MEGKDREVLKEVFTWFSVPNEGGREERKCFLEMKAHLKKHFSIDLSSKFSMRNYLDAMGGLMEENNCDCYFG